MNDALNRMQGPVRLIVLLLITGLVSPVWAQTIDYRTRSEIEDKAGMSGVIPTFPVAEPIDPEKYICGVGDQFLIHMWGKKEARLAVSITVEGGLFIPSIGRLSNLAGKNLKEVKNRIRGKIETVYNNLLFDIYLSQPRTFVVYVSGFAKSPGENTATAVTRISRFSRKAGGPDKFGSQRFVEIWRKGELYQTVDFFRLYRFGEKERDIYLLDGDVINYPLRGRKVKIYGAVRVPGDYELAEEENLRTLVDVHCAGLTEDLSGRDEMEIVRRFETDQFAVYRHDIETLKNGEVELKDEDSIMIPDLNRYQKVIRVQGAVVGKGSISLEAQEAARQARKSDSDEMALGRVDEMLPGAGQGASQREFFGVYHYIEGETVSQVLNRAGGVTPWADLNNAFVRRPLKNGDNEFDTISVDLKSILIEKDFSKDTEMKAGDFLVVPSIDDKVFIVGEVIDPGSQNYAPYYTVRYYVGQAGGQTVRASIWKSKIIHADGTKSKLDMDSIINPGDTILLREKTFKFWQDYWTILTGTAALVLSGFAVVWAVEQRD